MGVGQPGGMVDGDMRTEGGGGGAVAVGQPWKEDRGGGVVGDGGV